MPRGHIPLVALGAVHLVVLCAGFLSPYDPAVQFRDSPLHPPVRVVFHDGSGRWSIRPHVCWSIAGAPCRRVPVRFFVRGAPGPASGMRLFGVEEPARVFLLGTDAFGRDQLSRLLYGGQISLLSGTLGAAISLAIGVFLGAVAGYSGRFLDAVIMRLVELTLALPWIYLLFGLRAFLPLQMPPRLAFLLVIAVLGCIGWPVPARLIRGAVLSLREREFVLAARGFGGSHAYILRRHILPQTVGIVATQAVMLVPRFVLAEMTLSFLGLGVPEPVPSWGNMLAGVQQFHILTSCSWMLAPGLVFIPVMFAYVRLAHDLTAGRGSETM